MSDTAVTCRGAQKGWERLACHHANFLSRWPGCRDFMPAQRGPWSIKRSEMSYSSGAKRSELSDTPTSVRAQSFSVPDGVRATGLGLTRHRTRQGRPPACPIIWTQIQEAGVARRKSQEKQTPKPAGQLTRMEEANVARLGLISIQERIPADFTTWTVNFQVDGRPAKLTCIGSPDVGGVPHVRAGAPFVPALAGGVRGRPRPGGALHAVLAEQPDVRGVRRGRAAARPTVHVRTVWGRGRGPECGARPPSARAGRGRARHAPPAVPAVTREDGGA